MERSPLFLFAIKSCRKIVVHSSLLIAAEKWRKKANVNRRKRNTRREQQEKRTVYSDFTVAIMREIRHNRYDRNFTVVMFSLGCSIFFRRQCLC